jgi:opacity protein-like surface antigen
MKKFILTAAALGLMTSGAAFADGMDNAVGNTVRIIVNDAGEGFDVYFDAGGVYSDSLGRTGATWAFDEQLCITPPPDAGAETSCGPWNEDLDTGGSWQTDGWSDDGTMITISILEGRGHEAPTPPTPPAE